MRTPSYWARATSGRRRRSSGPSLLPQQASRAAERVSSSSRSSGAIQSPACTTRSASATSRQTTSGRSRARVGTWVSASSSTRTGRPRRSGLARDGLGRSRIGRGSVGGRRGDAVATQRLALPQVGPPALAEAALEDDGAGVADRVVRGVLAGDVLGAHRRPGADDGAVAEHDGRLDAVGMRLGDDVVVSLPNLVPVLAARDAHPGVVSPPEDGPDVGADGLLVPTHLQVTGTDLPDPLAHPQLQAALGEQWLRRLLRPHERGGVDDVDLLLREAARDDRSLLPSQLGEVGTGFAGVEEVGDVRAGLAVADEDETHTSIMTQARGASLRRGAAGR